jgi:tRNA U34 5-carboxymethylaminomethyl modifying GTPase MnmE/TrmE
MSGPAPNRSRDDQIVALWATHSTRQIAEIIGLSGQRVAKIAQRLYGEKRLYRRPSWWRYE